MWLRTFISAIKLTNSICTTWDNQYVNKCKGELMSLLGILTWIVIGGLAGWIAGKIMNTDDEQGIFGNILVGILGAFVGGILLEMLTGDDAVGFFANLLVAIIGASIVIAVWKVLRRA